MDFKFRARAGAFACLIASAITMSAHGAPAATYIFNNNFNAVESGVAPLTSVDPLGIGAFQTATVFGTPRTTWHFDGASTPASQGGLNFNTTGLIPSNNYSVEMVFELTGSLGWRRLLDSLDRQSDSGLYIDPNSALNLFPNANGAGGLFVANSFFDVFVTIDPFNTVTGYLNGAQQFSTTSTNLDVATNTLGFFLDNFFGGGLDEWSSGNVALIKVFNSALTPSEVMTATADPFAGTTPTSTVPEPGTLLLLGLGLAIAGFVQQRHRKT